MAVRNRPGRGWTIDFRLPTGERVRKRSLVQTRRGAEEEERRLRENWQRTGTVEPEREPPREEVTFKEFSEKFMTNWVAVHNRPAERAQKRSVLDRHLLPAMGARKLSEIDAQALDEYAARKSNEDLNPNTVNHHLAVISKMLRVAQDWGVVEKVPRLRKLPVPPPKSDFLLPEEAARLVTAAEGEWRTAILVGLRAGLRVSEIIALRWGDLDLVAGKIRVHRSRWRDTEGPPKSGKDREVPLSDDLREALRSHRHLRGEYVFSQADGKPWTRDGANTGLWRACRKAGLRRVGWHLLRHSFASHLLMAGRSIKEVQELLGHADLGPTLRYAHLAPDAKRDAVRALDALARRPAAAERAEGER